jgi:hypothetical protein
MKKQKSITLDERLLSKLEKYPNLSREIERRLNRSFSLEPNSKNIDELIVFYEGEIEKLVKIVAKLKYKRTELNAHNNEQLRTNIRQLTPYVFRSGNIQPVLNKIKSDFNLSDAELSELFKMENPECYGLFCRLYEEMVE